MWDKSEGFALLLQNCFIGKVVLKNNMKQINRNVVCVLNLLGLVIHPNGRSLT